MATALVLLLALLGRASAESRTPPRFAARADDHHVWVSWDGQVAEIRTSVVGGRHGWDRAIALVPTHVEVRDTVTNPSDAIIGVHVRHAFAPGAGTVRLGGHDDPDLADAYAPWNPTVFGPVGRGGLGLVAEDDVLRQQVHVAFDPREHAASLRTDMLCLGPHQSQTLVWSVYPIASASYWDFINAVRRDWGVNYTVPGSYIWFTPDQILALPDETLRAALERQRVAFASMWGGWVDPQRSERPPLIGFGTAVLRPEFADLRRRLRAAIGKLVAARPGITVLAYFDAQRDSSIDAPRRYAASLLVRQKGGIERTDWGGRYAPTWGMVPTTTDRFGQKMGTVARAMRRLGAGGLYWDEMDGVDYRAPRLTVREWDGRSCLLAEDGGVTARVGLVNLVSEEAKLGYAAEAEVVLGNMPPTTRRFQARPDLRMVEAHHGASWAPFAHLATPLGYIGGERRDWAMMVETIDQGLLPAGTRLDYDYDLPARLFPFTPEYLEPGTLEGRERIVTTRSGTHGWRGDDGPVHAYRYDAGGKEHSASWHIKHRPAGVFVRVRLAPGEIGLLERAR